MSPPLSLAQVLPVDQSGGGDATLTLALLAAGVLGAALAGVLLGGSALARVSPSLLAALAVGILLFLAHDLLKETASLGQGLLANPPLMVGILASFALGTLILPSLGGGRAA